MRRRGRPVARSPEEQCAAHRPHGARCLMRAEVRGLCRSHWNHGYPPPEDGGEVIDSGAAQRARAVMEEDE